VGYAEEIFSLGEELLDVVRHQSARVALPFRVGIADSVAKSLAARVVQPALRLEEPVRLVCREGRLVSLLAELAVHRLDIVIADRPMPADVKVRAYNHLLGSSDLTVFGARAVVQALKGAFPSCLEDAPFLLPGEAVAVRPLLEQWFEREGVRPRIVGEFDDSALMKAFAQEGAGLFAAPTTIADYVCRQYAVEAVGRIPAVNEQLYAITPERRLRHPATVAVSEAAAREVFAAAEQASAAVGQAHQPPAQKARKATRRAVKR
jgi:LysR family transcriptional activator of nhaA